MVKIEFGALALAHTRRTSGVRRMTYQKTASPPLALGAPERGTSCTPVSGPEPAVAWMASRAGVNAAPCVIDCGRRCIVHAPSRDASCMPGKDAAHGKQGREGSEEGWGVGGAAWRRVVGGVARPGLAVVPSC